MTSKNGTRVRIGAKSRRSPAVFGTVSQPQPLIRIAIILIAGMVATASFAKEKKPKKKPQDSHPTVITAVTANAITIREAKAEKTVPMTAATEIYVRDKRPEVTALQPGMAVSVTLAMDGDKASRVNASDPPPVRDDTDDRPKKRR